MKSDIFEILSNALERSISHDKIPPSREKSSVPEQKTIENLCQSSEYRNYVEEHLINGVAILTNNDKDFVYAEIAKLSTFDIKELK
jgi:hypothetical protein